ncbi:MAG: thioredoxin domain-containing protein [Myxococcota bacterium]
MTTAPVVEGPYVGPAPDDGVVRYRVPVTAAQPTIGFDTAPVTVVVFADFRCPISLQVPSTLERITARYGEDIRIVWRHFPLAFLEYDRAAASLATAAFRYFGHEGFWDAQRVFFSHEGDLGYRVLEQDGLQLGLSEAAITASFYGVHNEAIEADLALAARVGVRGTPTFFINGERIPGNPSEEVLASAIERARNAADFVYEYGARDAYEALMVHAQPEDRESAAPPTSTSDESTCEQRPPPPEMSFVITESPRPDHDFGILEPTSAPFRGSPTPQIVVQVFSGFHCAPCRPARAILDELVVEFGERVKFVFRHYPRLDGRLAAEASVEVFEQVGNAGFWRFHDLLFDGPSVHARSELERRAAQVDGLDLSRLRQALDRGTHTRKVQRDIDELAFSGVRGQSPIFIVNGRHPQGAPTIATLRRAILRELAR